MLQTDEPLPVFARVGALLDGPKRAVLPEWKLTDLVTYGTLSSRHFVPGNSGSGVFDADGALVAVVVTEHGVRAVTP